MLGNFFSELAARNKALYWFGWMNIGLLILALGMMALDDTMILGINAWIKPMKFAISISIYAWTYGWLLHYSTNQLANRLITIGLIISMTVEVALIYMQSFRGTTSHFNIQSSFDGIVFAIMGVFIAMNTLVNFYTVLVFFSSKITLQRPLLWAWRGGLLLFLFGSASGGWMVSHLGHTVGAPDGGAGLPLVNWSTVAGDIRAAHFITLHGLQALPIATYFLMTYAKENAARWSAIFGLAYVILCIYLHVLAFLGLPVIAG